MTAYLGGKHRQGPAIAEQVEKLRGDRRLYVEPFHGMMGSASAVARRLPDMELELSDANPYLVRTWEALLGEGWEPPKNLTMAEYLAYRERYRAKDPTLLDDPMTAYVGFGFSFSARFFSAPARAKRGADALIYEHLEEAPARRSTFRKRDALLGAAGIAVGCRDYQQATGFENAVVYLDPPYFGRIGQGAGFEAKEEEFFAYCEALADPARGNVVLVSAFEVYDGCEVVHNWGNTIAQQAGVTVNREVDHEVLMRVLPA